MFFVLCSSPPRTSPLRICPRFPEPAISLFAILFSAINFAAEGEGSIVLLEASFSDSDEAAGTDVAEGENDW